MNYNIETIKKLVNDINEYLFNEKNKCLVEYKINERTVCGCIKEYLDFYFKNTQFSVDLEYNKDIYRDSDKVLSCLSKSEIDDLNISCDGVDIEALCKLYSNLLEEYCIKLINNDKVEDFEIAKTYIPDIIVHKRGSNSNLLLFEVKKKSTKKSKIDLIKLAVIKYSSFLNYEYYIYFEYDDKTKKKENTEVYFLTKKGNYKFKKIDIL